MAEKKTKATGKKPAPSADKKAEKKSGKGPTSAQDNNPVSPKEESIPENPVQILHQYLKDLSFESPLSPAIFINRDKSPEVDLSVNVGCDPFEDKKNLFEVTLSLRARIYDEPKKGEVQNHFMAELHYAGLVKLHDKLDASLRNPALLIEAPRMLFPFARSILSDLTRDGGFPPLFIQPIDFASLYRREILDRQKAKKS